MPRRSAAWLLPLLLAVACAGGHAGHPRAAPPSPVSPPSRSSPPSAGDTVSGPCGSRPHAPHRYAHVVWIWMENQSYGAVLGSPAAPYLNRLARACGLATRYHNVTHPSLPNYLAAVAGTTGGVTSDCGPDECPQRAPTLFGQVAAAGGSWAAYQELMPGPCAHASSWPYAAKHNPPVYYPALASACPRDDVAMGGSGGAFATALRSGELPTFSFVTPDLCDDTHDCPVAVGDRWLSTWVPRILASPAYRTGVTALFITWDEGEGGATNDCATATADPGCHVPLVVVAPSVAPGTTVGAEANHFSLLRTTEQLLGLPPLGAAAGAPGLRAAFRL